MRLLSIDLGSRVVGWADFRIERAKVPDLVQVGRWEIQSKRTETPGIWWLRFDAHLERTFAATSPDLVAYEEVKNHTSRTKGRKGPTFNVAAAHAYGGAEAVLQAFFARHAEQLELLSVTVQDVKHAALAKGGGKGTSKEKVLEAAIARWPGHAFLDDNVSDAAFVGLAAAKDVGLAALCACCDRPLMAGGRCFCLTSGDPEIEFRR